jgi:hypothetical protein
VRTPTLVVAGQNDRITAPGASRVLATTLPDARYVEMRRAAHAPFLSHRKEFIAVLEQFLQTSDADTAAAAGPPPTASHTPPEAPTAAAVASAGRSLPAALVAAADPPVKPAATPPPTHPVRAAKKKRMKARARKKLQASTR